MFKAALFDMDGVIVDTEHLHRSAYFQMFNEVNIEVSNELYESFTGQSTQNICQQIVDYFNLPLCAQTLIQLKRDYFKELFENDKSLHLLHGVLELIKDYYNNNMSLVLASSASMENINKIFERFDLNKYFSGKVSGADLENSKPNPEIFIKAAELAGFSPDECFVIEDSTNGIEASNAAGIFCVGYKSKHSKNQDYSKANVVILEFNDISFSELQKLNKVRGSYI
ncbi:MAG: HAD family phosphatase [Bacteroidota bacterium]